MTPPGRTPNKGNESNNLPCCPCNRVVDKYELSLNEMLGEIVGLASQSTGCDACLVYLVETATDEFVLRASLVPHKDDVGRLRLKLGEGVTGWVAQHQLPVALGENASADPRFKAFSVLVEDTYGVLIGSCNQ